MPGPAFVHFATYSRKPNPGGNSIAQIIAEALRKPEFSRHVENPGVPRVLHGDPEAFEDLHAAHLEKRATEVKRKGKVHKRAIRADRHTLATAVASYPLTHEQIAAGGAEARAHHQEWERLTHKWMRDRYGDQLRVALAHDDEAHPHIHFWLLPDDPDARADTLHPGKVAKREAEALARGAGLSDREAVRVGNDALKVAMRAVLDDYHQTVGERLGMTRDGPKRRRLTRKEWQAEKAEAVRRAEALKRAEGAEKVVQDAEAQAAAVIENADARDAETKAKRGKFNDDARDWVAKNRKALADRQAELDSIEKGLGVKVAAFEVEKAETVAKLEKGLEEVKTLRQKFNGLIDQAEAFLRRSDLPDLARKAGAALMKVAGRPVPKPDATGAGDREAAKRRRLGAPPASSALPRQPSPEPAPAPVDRSGDFSL